MDQYEPKFKSGLTFFGTDPSAQDRIYVKIHSQQSKIKQVHECYKNIDRQKHQRTEFEVVINNVPTFITASGTGASIQNAKVTTHTGMLCIAAFSYLVYEDDLTSTTTKKN